MIAQKYFIFSYVKNTTKLYVNHNIKIVHAVLKCVIIKTRQCKLLIDKYLQKLVVSLP